MIVGDGRRRENRLLVVINDTREETEIQSYCQCVNRVPAAAKATKKFAASGQLRKTIKARRKYQRHVKKNGPGNKGVKNGAARTESEDEDVSDEDVGVGSRSNVEGLKGMTVDDLLQGSFMDVGEDKASGSDEEQSVESDGDDLFEENGLPDTLTSLEGEIHRLELSQLAEKDPEFYKYLQDNDRELLNFDLDAPINGVDDEDEGIMHEMEDELPVLSMDILQKWQKAILEFRSLRAFRKLLIAFRSATHMNEEGYALAWRIDGSAVYNKLVTTTLHYTPLILQHHAPYRALPNGKFKPPVQTDKLKALQKIVLSYFQNIIHLFPQLTDSEMIQMSITQSAKIVPYIVSSHKAVRQYLKKCLEFWSSTEEGVRIAAFAAIRELASSLDESILESILKGVYLTLVRSSKVTNAYSLPSINFMKHSASEFFCIDHAMSYQHAFRYIRQLAIHLRNSMKVKTKEAYQQVYNWQYMHCVDFWAMVLSRSSNTKADSDRESELQALVYPLVQVSLGAIKHLSNSRSFPFHFQIVRSLVSLSNHTGIYIPIAPYLLPIITSNLSPSTPSKPSTIRPLDLELHIRAPRQYLRTRVYANSLIEEAVFLLAEWLASKCVHGSIAYPEVVVSVVIQLRRALKSAKSLPPSKGNIATSRDGGVKGLVERIEESALWVESKRKEAVMSPGNIQDVEEWESKLKASIEHSPLSKFVKVLRKIREKQRMLAAKARVDEDEIIED